MGGGYYDRDVGLTEISQGGDGAHHTQIAEAAMTQRGPHADLQPRGRVLECGHQSPIVVAMDVTRSRGNDSKVVYDKIPMLYGQLLMQGYLEDPAISFAAIGDADGDRAPLQVCDFASGTELDRWLTKVWLEEGGGGTGRESYELRRGSTPVAASSPGWRRATRASSSSPVTRASTPRSRPSSSALTSSATPRPA